jgi:DNA-binding HxlR family transcriptional regulator
MKNTSSYEEALKTVLGPAAGELEEEAKATILERIKNLPIRVVVRENLEEELSAEMLTGALKELVNRRIIRRSSDGIEVLAPKKLSVKETTGVEDWYPNYIV